MHICVLSPDELNKYIHPILLNLKLHPTLFGRIMANHRKLRTEFLSNTVQVPSCYLLHATWSQLHIKSIPLLIADLKNSLIIKEITLWSFTVCWKKNNTGPIIYFLYIFFILFNQFLWGLWLHNIDKFLSALWSDDISSINFNLNSVWFAQRYISNFNFEESILHLTSLCLSIPLSRITATTHQVRFPICIYPAVYFLRSIKE